MHSRYQLHSKWMKLRFRHKSAEEIHSLNCARRRRTVQNGKITKHFACKLRYQVEYARRTWCRAVQKTSWWSLQRFCEKTPFLEFTHKNHRIPTHCEWCSFERNGVDWIYVWKTDMWISITDRKLLWNSIPETVFLCLSQLNLIITEANALKWTSQSVFID